MAGKGSGTGTVGGGRNVSSGGPGVAAATGTRGTRWEEGHITWDMAWYRKARQEEEAAGYVAWWGKSRITDRVMGRKCRYTVGMHTGKWVGQHKEVRHAVVR